MLATGYRRTPPWANALLGLLCLLVTAGCGVHAYETQMEESLKARREQIQLMEDLKKQAAEHPESASTLNLEKMSKEELEAEANRVLESLRKANAPGKPAAEAPSNEGEAAGTEGEGQAATAEKKAPPAEK